LYASIDEAAADMFLNWVYRINNDPVYPPVDTCALTPTPTPDHWSGSGFLNRDWIGQTSPPGTPTAGNLNTTLPGDRRYYHMHQFVLSIFSQNPTW